MILWSLEGLEGKLEQNWNDMYWPECFDGVNSNTTCNLGDDIPAQGGECGPRAWFARFCRRSFGLPVWGIQQPGNAAMTTWSKDGWAVLLGAAWKFSYWQGRGGPDFFLETQCRELRPEFQKVLRGQWVANALGEYPVDPAWGQC